MAWTTDDVGIVAELVASLRHNKGNNWEFVATLTVSHSLSQGSQFQARMATFPNLSEAYLHALHQLWYNPQYEHRGVTPDDMKDCEHPASKNPRWYFNKGANVELVNFAMTIVEPSDREDIVTHSAQRNKIIYDYSAAETVMFDNGDLVNIKQLSKVWQTIANPDGTINANYGHMVYKLKDAGNSKFSDHFQSQWDWAKSRLLLLKSTNQSYLHFNRPQHQWDENLDQPCCLNVQFQIRDDRLSLYVNMRSNDAVYGTPYNLLYFVKLMHRMLAELQAAKYPELTIGDLFYHTTSLHYYKKHADKVRDMLGLSE